jgi:glycosyltransferase involved in cell wall biosynthesis
MLQIKRPAGPSAPVKVSVVVPVFKVEEYVRKCLESLCKQTLKEIEIICVNDCSPDRSIDILREFEAKDSRVKVIDFPQNQGVAMARNAGLDASVGEFIGFVDPDDTVDPNFFETLYNKAQEAGADVAKGARKHVQLDGVEVHVTTNELVRQSKAFFSASFWSAIYRGSMIRENHIRFPAGIHIGEDLVFQARCILESKKFVTSDFVFYWYYRRAGSAVDAFYTPGAFMQNRQIDSVRSAFNLIIEYANKAYDAGKVDDVTYDTLFYNNLCFSVVVIMLTDDVHVKRECSELLVEFYQLCRRKEQLDQKLREEQSSFYEHLKEGDLKKLTRFFVENYTMADVIKANDVRSMAYFQR